jgi:uncharacterized protein (DUF433 family)
LICEAYHEVARLYLYQPGNRIKVEFVLKLMAAGWTVERMADEYPGILEEHVRAAAAFAADIIHEDEYIAIDRARAA